MSEQQQIIHLLRQLTGTDGPAVAVTSEEIANHLGKETSPNFLEILNELDEFGEIGKENRNGQWFYYWLPQIHANFDPVDFRDLLSNG